MKIFSAITTSLLLGFFALYASVYIVSDGEQGVLLQLGSVRPTTFQPGLHFVLPLVQRLKKFDLRPQVSRFISNPIALQKQNLERLSREDILLEYYIEWRISDLAKYFPFDKNAKWRDEVLSSAVENAFSKAFAGLNFSDAILRQSEELDARSLMKINEKVKEIGLEVIKAGAIKIDHPPEISDIILQRMQANYKQLAAEILALGDAEEKANRMQTEAVVAKINNEAQAKAAEIRAKAAAEAVSISQAAFKQAPKFFLWFQNLKAYEKIFAAGGKIIVVQPGSEIFKNLERK